MKAYPPGIRDGCLRVVKKIGWVHSSAKVPHAQGGDLFQSQSRSWRGQIKGLYFYPTLNVKQSGSLKEVTLVMESEPTR
jgi:hypothetical protein